MLQNDIKNAMVTAWKADNKVDKDVLSLLFKNARFHIPDWSSNETV